MLLPRPTFLIFAFKRDPEFSTQSGFLLYLLNIGMDCSYICSPLVNQKFRWLFYICLSSLLLLHGEKGSFLPLLLMLPASDIFMAFF